MKYDTLTIAQSLRRLLPVFTLSLLLPLSALAQDSGDDVDDNESAAMAKTKENAPTLQETDPTGANYFGQRRALVGKHCSVNRVINVVAVGSGTSGLENLTNENLDDYATFPSTAGVTVAASPTVSVRDMKYYYAPGTTAGFCIVASSGSSVVKLDVIKSMHIWFYCDGKRVDDQTVREGNAGSGVKLKLIGIPGSEDACVNLTATCSKKFDEVCLVQGGGLNADVASLIRMRYAFVGENHDLTITETNMEEMGYDAKCVGKMPSPLVGGIPLDIVSSYEERVIDDDLDNTMPIIAAAQLASVAYKGECAVWAGTNDNSRSEAFSKGDQVGFKYNFVEVADVLKVGNWVTIELLDHTGATISNTTTTINADVLTLSLASGGDQTVYIQASEDFSGAKITFYTALGVLNLGSGFGVYNAFVRPKPVVDHECTLNPSMNSNVCLTQTSYQLRHNPEINATWSVVSQPAENNGACSVTSDGYVTGMNAAGPYTFRVTAEDGCYEDVTLNHTDNFFDANSIAEIPIYNVDSSNPDYALSDDLHGETSANVLSISDFDNSDAVLNSDLTDAASYTGGLQLLGANGVIVGVKKLSTEEPYFYDGSKADAKESFEVGFIIEMERTSVGLDLLNAFQIRCFDENGTKLYQHIVENAGVLGLDLIGNVGNEEKSNKVRLSIKVPKVNGDGQPVKINEFQLWKIGTLDLNVSDVKIYYPFYADPTDARNNVVRNGAEVLNYDNYGSVVNLGTQVNVASVGGVTTNLSNIVDIDDELETYALVQKTVDVGSMEIIVKLGKTVDYRHQVGVVVDQDIVGLNVNLANVLRVGTYYNGEDTGEISGDWGVLGANVIQGSGKTVFLMQPTADFDEIHITAGSGLSANNTLKIYGILLRNDIDHDGIPDNQDAQSCFDAINDVEASKVCVGTSITVTAKGSTGTNYYISLPDQNVEHADANSDIDGNISVSFETIKAGRYTLYFYDGSDNLIGTADYTVHPISTTWRTTTTSTDWNSWDNWTNGSPYLCTSVIMPTGARAYPVLTDDVINGDEFGCNGIHFEHGAAVENVFRLNYAKAWVDFTPESGRYYLMATPLKSTYTGDYFVADAVHDTISVPGYFQDIAGAFYFPNRFEPRFYQRLYAQQGTHKLASGDTQAATILETNWSQRFNALATAYTLGQGFSLYMDNEGREGDLTVRLPKEHTAYYYFYEGTRQQSDIQESGLTRTDNHRFIYEDASRSTDGAKDWGAYGSRTVYDQAGGMSYTTPTLPNEATATTFLIGNPFMSHIRIDEFLEANPHVTAVKVFDGQTTSSVISVDGTMLSTETGTGTRVINPMEAFFVEVATAASSVTVAFNGDMFGPATAAAPSPTRSLMRIKAATDKASASALLLDDDVRLAETLIDGDVKPQVAVFTLQDGKACDIRSLRGDSEIEIGVMRSAAAGEEVTFSFEALGDIALSDYQLLDRETARTYPLDELPAFRISETCIGRFVLVNNSVTGIDNLAGDALLADGLQINVKGTSATISSDGAALRSVRVYSASGQLIARVPASKAATVRLPEGVSLIKVDREGLPSRTYRVLAR